MGERREEGRKGGREEGRRGGRGEQEMKTGSYNKEFVQEDWSSSIQLRVLGMFLLRGGAQENETNSRGSRVYSYQLPHAESFSRK